MIEKHARISEGTKTSMKSQRMTVAVTTTTSHSRQALKTTRELTKPSTATPPTTSVPTTKAIQTTTQLPTPTARKPTTTKKFTTTMLPTTTTKTTPAPSKTRTPVTKANRKPPATASAIVSTSPTTTKSNKIFFQTSPLPIAVKPTMKKLPVNPSSVFKTNGTIVKAQSRSVHFNGEHLLHGQSTTTAKALDNQITQFLEDAIDAKEAVEDHVLRHPSAVPATTAPSQTKPSNQNVGAIDNHAPHNPSAVPATTARSILI